MKADPQTEAAVLSFLQKFSESYANRDLDALLALFAPDPDVVMYGTGADEKRVGLDEIKVQVERDWSQSDATSITYKWTSVSAAGPVAWVAADMAFQVQAGGQQMTLEGRLTGVLEKRRDEWLMVQGHYSLPASAQSEGESFPT
jgi:ketosteroid isomerase-like protein